MLILILDEHLIKYNKTLIYHFVHMNVIGIREITQKIICNQFKLIVQKEWL